MWAKLMKPTHKPQKFGNERPRRSPLGGWERVYLMCDGSIQMAYSPDGNFDAWEQSNYANSFPTPSQ